MTNRDVVAEFADRIEERRRRGEDYEAEFDQAGVITTMEFVERVRGAVPDLPAQPA